MLKYITCLVHWWRTILYIASLSADIVDGNLKSVMRIILALAAHFKPSANQRTATGSGRTLTRGNGSHNPLSTVALAQGAVAALASAQLDASQPACVARIHRYADHTGNKHRHIYFTIKPFLCLPEIPQMFSAIAENNYYYYLSTSCGQNEITKLPFFILLKYCKSEQCYLCFVCYLLSFSGWGLDVEKSVCVRALVEQYERGAPDEQDNPLPGR